MLNIFQLHRLKLCGIRLAIVKSKYLKLCSLALLGLCNISSLYAVEHQISTNVAIANATSIPKKTASLDLPEHRVEAHFKEIVVKIDSTLFADQTRLKSDASHLEKFVDSNILPYWNADLTLKQLVGSKNWKSFSQKEIDSLQVIFNKTLHRYVREGMDYYDGQRVKLLKAELNKKQTRGLVTIQLQPIYLPAFNIIFKIARKSSSSGESWLLYDVLVEGISYVKTKKNEYRRLVDEQGVQGLLAHLDKKNNTAEMQAQAKLSNKSTAQNNAN